MTMAPPDTAPSDAVPSAPDPSATAQVVIDVGPEQAPAAPTVNRVVRQRTVARRRRRKRLLFTQGGLTVVFVAALLLLALVGWDATLGITGGTEKVTDPAAPGYVAEVKPTAVTLIAFDHQPLGIPEFEEVEGQELMPIDEGKALATALLVVERSGEQPAAISPIPAQTLLWPFEDSEAEPAGEVYSTGGIHALALRTGQGLTFGATETITVHTDMLLQLAQMAGPITVNVPDDVLVATQYEPPEYEVRYPHGALTLQPEEVPEYFRFRGDLETVSNFSLRLDLAWQELIKGAAASTAELNVDANDADQAAFAEIMDNVLRAETVVAPLPFSTSPDGANGAEEYGLPEGIDSSAMPTWVTGQLPYPVSAYPGQRVKVEMLNGTSSPDALRTAAPLVIGANAEIAWTGNAESFDVAQTRVEYPRPELEPPARAIATALGVSATENPGLSSHGEIVVVIGTDR